MTTTLLVSVVVALLTALVSVGVLVHAIRRTRREPRRLSNGFWLLAGALLTLELAAGLGIPGAGAVQGLIVLLVVGAPLLIAVIAVFLVANGVTMMRKESRSLGNLLSLIAGVALLAVMLSPLVLLIGAPTWLLGLLLLVGLAAAYAGFVFVGFLLYSWLYPRLVRGRRSDWVVVLGSGLIDGHVVPPLLAGRIAAGLAAAADRKAQVVIMSGGRGSDERVAEAEAMAAWAVEHGADPAYVLVEDQSRNTEENLRFTSALLAERSPALLAPVADAALPAVPPAPSTTPAASATQRTRAGLDRLLGGPIERDAPGQGLIVTSDYHVLRAAILARHLGLPAQASGARTARYYWPSAMLREFIALVVGRRRLHLILGTLIAVPLPVLVLLLGYGR